MSRNAIVRPSRAVAKVAVELLRAGMNIGEAGSDGAPYPGLAVHTGIWAYVAAGMSPAEALRTAMLNSALLLGLDQDLGSIEAGKIADLVILNSNPLDDIHNTTDIAFVMKDRVLRNAKNLDMVWPRAERGPRFWFRMLTAMCKRRRSEGSKLRDIWAQTFEGIRFCCFQPRPATLRRGFRSIEMRKS